MRGWPSDREQARRRRPWTIHPGGGVPQFRSDPELLFLLANGGTKKIKDVPCGLHQCSEALLTIFIKPSLQQTRQLAVA